MSLGSPVTSGSAFGVSYPDDKYNGEQARSDDWQGAAEELDRYIRHQPQAPH